MAADKIGGFRPSYVPPTGARPEFQDILHEAIDFAKENRIT